MGLLLWKLSPCKATQKCKELWWCHGSYPAGPVHISVFEEQTNKIMQHIPYQPPPHKFSIMFYYPDTMLEATCLKDTLDGCSLFLGRVEPLALLRKRNEEGSLHPREKSPEVLKGLELQRKGVGCVFLHGRGDMWTLRTPCFSNMFSRDV